MKALLLSIASLMALYALLHAGDAHSFGMPGQMGNGNPFIEIRK